MRQAVTDLGQTIVMVTHDAVAAGYSDRVIFLADGKIVDELKSPTAETVIDRVKEHRRVAACASSRSRGSSPTSCASRSLPSR